MKFKPTAITVFSVFSILFITSCADQGGYVPSDNLNTRVDSVSYALGYQNGLFLSDEGVEDLETSKYLSGFLSALVDSTAKMSDSEMAIIINDFRTELRDKVVEANKTEGQDFLEENLQNEDIMETESGLQYKVIEEGSGDRPTATSTVKVNYEGRLIDGTIFDSSYQRGEPIEFPLNRVIKGWTEGLQLMREGATYELYIPSELGYGNQGAGQVIKPGATLIFKVELLEVK